MNARPVATLVATSLLALLALPAVVSAQDMPRRKSGLWETTMENSAAKGTPGGKMTMTQCVDAAKDDVANQAAQQMGRDNKCSTGKVSQTPGRVSFDSTCEFAGTKMSSSTVIAGDFNSAYKMEIKAKYNPPMMGMSESTTTMDAKFIGACKPGMRPGDVTMPGGMTMNVYDMMEGKKK